MNAKHDITSHTSVLFREALEALGLVPGAKAIDGTGGSGGHSAGILQRTAPDGKLLVIDRDPAACVRCEANLREYGNRVVVRHANFADIAKIAEAEGFTGADAILFDFGLSSPQLNDLDRGFSFNSENSFDMRMDTSRGQTAAELLDSFNGDWKPLAEIIRKYGEDPFAAKIAKAVMAAHTREPIRSTARFAAIVEAAVGRHSAKHPATRAIQGIRVALNLELDSIREGLESALGILGENGRCAAISFNSLESKIVKAVFGSHIKREIALMQGGSETTGKRPWVRKVHGKTVKPSADEVKSNPRSRSAEMRAVARI